MSLPNYELKPHIRPADWVLEGRERFDLNAPYQRDSEWTVPRKRELIRSLLMGLPIGAIIINIREGAGARYAIVDGKQRIEALRDMADGQIGIPADWVPKRFQGNLHIMRVDGESVPAVVVDSPEHPFMSLLMNFAISTIEAKVPTVRDEAMMFCLVNTAGKPLGMDTLERAQDFANGVAEGAA
tara:strand:+ start:8349 stop:8900 length:552 start_codon:yes stop_codon:yes gene_type:complete